MSQDSPQQPPEQPTEINLSPLIQKANAGDREALKSLRQVLNAHPEIWRKAGDMGALVQRLMGAQIASTHFARESLRRKTQELRAQLLGTSPSPIERLAVERVVTTWMQIHQLDMQVAALGGDSSRWAVALAKRHDQASRRYDRALKSLATLRRLVPLQSTSVPNPAEGVQVYRPGAPADTATPTGTG